MIEINELELLIKLKLFTTDEIRYIKENRDKYDQKLCFNKYENESTINALEFEMKFLDDISNRRSVVCNNDKQMEIQLAIINRLVRIYVNAMSNVINMERVILSQMERYECKITDYILHLTKEYPNVDTVWKLAGRWYMEKKLYDEASRLFFQGVENNCTSESLYYDLLNAELKKAIEQKSNDFSRVKDIFVCILENIANDTNLEFVFALIKLVDEYKPLTNDLQKELIGKTKLKFEHKEMFWYLLALRQLVVFHSDVLGTDELQLNDTKRSRCLNIFQLATNQLETPCMWKLFLDTLLLSNQFDDVDRNKYLQEAYRLSQIKQQMYLEEHHLLKLVELNKERKEEIMDFSTTMLPKSERLWCEYMLLYFEDDKIDNIERIFKNGIEALQEKALPLWRLKIKFYMILFMKDSKQLIESIRHIYLTGIIRQPPEITEPLQTSFLEWLVTQQGLPQARKSFSSIAQASVAMNCLKKMIELELSHADPNMMIIKGLLDLRCKIFGHVDIESWLNLAEFNNFPMIDNKNAQNDLYECAMRKLATNLQPIFRIRYQLLNVKDRRNATRLTLSGINA